MNERCHVCHRFKPIAKREKASIQGTAHRFRQFLICADCDGERLRQYEVSQRRYAQEQIELIDQIVASRPEMAESLAAVRSTWERQAKQQ